MPKKCIASTIAMMLLGLAVSPAHAQSGDFAAGWSFLRSIDLEESFPLGFNVGAAGRITDRFGIAGDFGWNQKGDEFEDIVSLDLTVLTFSAGPRIYFGSERVTGFAHALVGIARAEVAASLLGTEESESNSELLVQPGGGVDLGVTEAFAVRLQGDYQWIKDSDGNFRFVVAAVFQFGK